jgi:exosortase
MAGLLHPPAVNDRPAHPAASVAVLAALWLPAMLAASYAWRFGEYYDYGWFVPPAALFLLARRWRETGPPQPVGVGRLAAAALPFLAVVLVLRVLHHADPSWRLPVGLLGLAAAAAGHGYLAAIRDWRDSARFGLITMLLLSAMPWPSVIEHSIVRMLTTGVVETVAEVFQILGRPVEVTGHRLRLLDVTVEVSDGCSGVRSFQSFLMANWFFAELYRLRPARTLILLGCACAIAFLVNSGRTYALAAVRFDHGEAAFERAHDAAGLVAFAVSAGLFFLISGRLADGRPRRTVRRHANAG